MMGAIFTLRFENKISVHSSALSSFVPRGREYFRQPGPLAHLSVEVFIVFVSKQFGKIVLDAPSPGQIETQILGAPMWTTTGGVSRMDSEGGFQDLVRVSPGLKGPSETLPP